MKERALGTSPTDADSDDDGVSDGVEVTGVYATDPLDADTYGDGLCDGGLAVAGVCARGEDLDGEPVFAAMPAVAAGQVGLWNRDFPVSYAGATAFLETILETLRTAEKVTGASATPTA